MLGVTYFVSGYMRCGTSMMMDALTAGGLSPAFNPERDRMNEVFGDEHYQPNPNGFYELSRKEYQETGFPRGYEGKLIKILFGGINRIVAGNYKIIFMRRDFEEIRQSYEGFFGNVLQITENELIAKIEDAIGILKQRRDVDITEVWYRDVIEDPLKVFTFLKGRGWPIDPEKAAEVVNPELCRFRLENLEVGI